MSRPNLNDLPPNGTSSQHPQSLIDRNSQQGHHHRVERSRSRHHASNRQFQMSATVIIILDLITPLDQHLVEIEPFKDRVRVFGHQSQPLHHLYHHKHKQHQISLLFLGREGQVCQFSVQNVDEIHIRISTSVLQLINSACYVAAEDTLSRSAGLLREHSSLLNDMKGLHKPAVKATRVRLDKRINKLPRRL